MKTIFWFRNTKEFDAFSEKPTGREKLIKILPNLLMRSFRQIYTVRLPPPTLLEIVKDVDETRCRKDIAVPILL